MRRLLALCTASISFALIHGAIAGALAIPSAPPLETPIVDQTKTLSTDQITELSQLINQERSETQNQIAILIIPSLEGESLEEYSIEVARSWGVGQKDKDNGVLLLVAMNDHQLRIEVGTGLEGDLTDARSSRIIRGVISPAFKNGEYYEGIRAGIVEIQAAIRGEAESSELSDEFDLSSSDTFFTLLFLASCPFIWLSSILGRSKSWWAGGVVGGAIGLVVAFFASFSGWWLFIVVPGLIGFGLILDYLVSKNYKKNRSRGSNASWWAGGGSWGGGGGSFGGGGFSGGGSSGGW